jgi:membrane protease YdiL (CAAX protease family)
MLRERKTIYLELLFTVGLLVLPSLMKAVYHFRHPEVPLAPGSAVSWQFASKAVIELLLLGLLWHVLRLNGESFADLMPPFTGRDILRGIGLSIWGYVSWYALALLLWKIAGGSSAAEQTRRTMDIFQTPFTAFYLVAILVNPFAEELFVRGFLQTRLRQAGHEGLAVVLFSAGLQTSYHLYQGLLPCLSLIPVFLVFALYYHANRRLWPVLIAHLIMDLLAMLANMKTV